MKRLSTFAYILLIAVAIRARGKQAEGGERVKGAGVTWASLGTNENDSMPIGNGDLAANVWTEPNGDLVLLVAKADAWTETGKLLNKP